VRTAAAPATKILASLTVGDRVVDPAELAARVDARREQLGPERRLVLLRGSNELEFVVTYLAARAGRHPLILTSPEASASLIDRYRPDVVVSTAAGGVELEHRHPRPIHELHPELALLMSTSGSTGAPKLVRLSHRNLDANAASIAEFQGLTPDDRGITSLPLHYCYGLSVLNAHLAAGASVVLTDLSVVDPCFWQTMATDRVTNLAGVPHTFELIEQIGIEHLRLESLRLVTQAGGRMRPTSVRELAMLGRQWGWDFLVMYGQTEATARMAYLPAELAVDRPDRVGIAIPGGELTIRDGEVVYRGPNVMMGYAESTDDLGRGAELDELATGDLGRFDEDGLLEIVGRRSRFAKLFGLRVDLARLEQQLAESGITAMCASDDARLVVGVEGSASGVRERTAAWATVPARSIDVVTCQRLPRLPNGKPDYEALLAMVPSPTPSATHGGDRRESIDAIFGDVLGVDRLDGSDTFASRGGDSFSYIEVSIRIESALGYVPEGWHVTPLDELRALEPKSRRRWIARVETNVVLRAFAIVAIVCTHMRVARIPAGAHILLAVVGFNYARFQLPRLAVPDPLRRAREMAKPIVRIAAVTVAWVAAQMVLFGGHGLATLLMVNNYLGGPEHIEGRWRYWFFEAMVQLMLVLFVVFSFSAVRRFERRRPFLFPLLLLIPAAAMRFELIRVVDRDYNYIYRPDTIVWCFLLGWAAARATSVRQRMIVTVSALVLVPDFFSHSGREVRLVIAVVLLAWLPTLPVPRLFAQPLGWLASASMWIFMTHWLIWPELTPHMPRWLAMVATIAAGAALWAAGRSARSVLRVLKPEPAFDAQVAVRDRRVGRRHDLDDRVVLDVQREIAPHAAVGAHGVGGRLA
jgi:hypothetical protein